jgi:cell division protein FtsL
MKNKNMYVSGSTAYAPERNTENPITREEYEKLRRAKIERSNRAKQKKNAKKRGTIVTIAGVFIIGFGVIWSEAQVYGIQNQLSSIKKEIVEVNKLNEDLRLQLVKVSSINNIKTIAEDKLHMSTPSRTNVMFADLSKNNFSELPKDNREGKAKELFLKIKNLLF